MTDAEFQKKLDAVVSKNDAIRSSGVVQFDGNKAWDALMSDLAADAIAEAKAVKAARQTNG